MKPESHRSPCPVACTLDLIGDKWTLLVVRDLALGKSHFSEFQKSPEGIATNILSNRLARLLEHGIVEKYPSETIPSREAYRLTKKGKTLKPILKSIFNWGLKYIEGTKPFDEMEQTS
ncbi:winged helix-turn-helix transcriptional regulator [Rubinisphaera italica]|nr:helix-turn-helix domain-containing protein [Rubinisphaera italica]HBN78540.1 transcriptional regulator [Planctomycetaceae bacterium]